MTPEFRTPFTLRVALCGLLLAAALASGCGGGGTRGAAVCMPGVATMACPGDTSTGSGGATGSPSLTLAAVDPSGAPTTQVAPDATGTVRATVKNSAGAAQPNVAVTFITTDSTGAFVPSSGTALTDTSGVARVGLPAGTRAGAYTVTASATVGGAATKGTLDYAVSFPTLTLSPFTITPATLSAGGNASVSTTVARGGVPYAPPLAVSFSSPCIVAGKATIGPPVLTQNGVAATSYTDKGCGVADTITASVTLGDATVVRTGTITVLPATAGSIKFISADTTNIALRGTGGFGRQEFATLKFEVYDTTGNKVPGTLVDFVFADSGRADTVGGLTLNPSFATSAADGSVTTLVTAGTIPTSVRVVATLRGRSPLVTTLSDVLVVSTGVPDQKHFSLATSIGNCEGRDIDQACSTVTATLGDHFGNPVPDGTAVNFSAEGGVVDASCVTGSLPPPGTSTPTGQTTNSRVGPGSGSCSVLLRSSNPRQANGRITVLAYALGEEDFTDTNGNNVYDSGETFVDKRPDIHRDDNENGSWNAGEACVGPGSGVACNTAPDGQFNGVLRMPQVPSPQTLYVSGQLVQIFSGSTARIRIEPSSLVCPARGTADVRVTVTDDNGNAISNAVGGGNIMPAGTTIDFSTISSGIVPFPVNPGSVKVNNVVLPVGGAMVIPTYIATVGCLDGGSGKFFVTVKTPSGVLTSANIPIN